MSPKRLKQCCKRSQDQGLTQCPTCHASLWPDETTLIRKTSQPKVRSTSQPKAVVPLSPSSATAQPVPPESKSNRSAIFGMIVACLVVFAIVVFADYLVQRRALEKQALVTPAPIRTASASPTIRETPTPKASPTAMPELVVPDNLVEETPTPKPRPTASVPRYDDWIAKQAPTAKPDFVSISTPRPTPRPAPRREMILHASDVLSTFSRSIDSRVYRFHLDETARIKGSFSASGGGVSIRIYSSGRAYYSSGSQVSSDTINLKLDPGTYELEVSFQSSRSLVSFEVNLTAYYDTE